MARSAALRRAWEGAVIKVFAVTPVVLRTAAIRLASPQHTVGVLAVLSRADGRILLVQQSYRLKWYLPGGRLKAGERATGAAWREIREELGITPDSLVDTGLAVHSSGSRWVTFLVTSQLSDADADKAAPVSREISRAEWFDPAELPSLEPGIAEALALVHPGTPGAATADS